jgi:hypothetical protein
MLILQPADILRVITGAAADIECYVAYVEAPYPLTPTDSVSADRSILASIVTATTTTILAGPSSGKRRTVKNVGITNNHASVASQVEVEIYDGTTNAVELIGVTLLPGENLKFLPETGWLHFDTQGGVYTYTPPINQNLGESGVIAETMPRELCPEVNTTGPASGTLGMIAIKLRAGDLVSSIDLWSATTASGTPTNQMVGLYDANRNLLAQAANKTTEAWAANSKKNFAMTTAYRVPVTGQYYIGFFTTATTVNTWKGGTARTGGQLGGAAPILYGTSNTGLTTALPNPANAITSSTAFIYAAVR